MPNYSDSLAEEYAEKRVNYRATEAEVFSQVDKLGVSGKIILDFGCGNGLYTDAFLQRGISQFVGIDDSPKMIELAKMFHSHPKVTFIIADGNILPFTEGSFDFVFANFVLHHFIDTLTPIREIYRVLNPGGVLLATMGAYEIPDNIPVDIGSYMPIRLGIEPVTTLVYNVLKSKETIKRELEKTGFEIETFKCIDNANARMDKSHPYKDKVTLVTLLILARKPDLT